MNRIHLGINKGFFLINPYGGTVCFPNGMPWKLPFLSHIIIYNNFVSYFELEIKQYVQYTNNEMATPIMNWDSTFLPFVYKSLFCCVACKNYSHMIVVQQVHPVIILPFIIFLFYMP